MANFMRAAVHGFTGSRLAPAPRRKLARYYRALARLSAAFAVVSDIAMLVLGGALKRREHLSGRLADALSELYLASAVLKRFTDDGEPGADQPLARYCLDRSLYRIQQSLFGVLQNFPLRALAWTLRLKLFPFGRSYRMPPDRLARDAAAVLLASSPARDRLTRGIFLPQDESAPLNRIERALEAVIAAEASEQKLRHARTTGKLDPGADLAAALKAGIVEPNEVALVEAASALRREVIAVDCFGAPRHGAPASKAKARTKTRRARSPRKPRKPKSRSS
jgi:acyl-CoA dehydrogenase